MSTLKKVELKLPVYLSTKINVYLFIFFCRLFSAGKSGVQGPVTPLRQDDPLDDTWYSIFPVENDELVYGTWEDEVIFWSQNYLPYLLTNVPSYFIFLIFPLMHNLFVCRLFGMQKI